MNSYSLVLLFAAAAVVAVSGSAVYPAVHLGPASSQYHAQDEFGQYAYGYSGGPSAKHEQRTADGVTRGGYSYVDANGLVQSVAYVADPVNGFRASGTNLPVDTAQPAVPVLHHQVPVAYPAPAYAAAYPAAYPAAPAALPSVVDARSLYHHAAVPSPLVVAQPSLVKLSQPLTPAGTSNVHYPTHASVLLARKRRSIDAYPHSPLVSYAAPAPPAHVVTVKHTELAAPSSHLIASPYLSSPYLASPYVASPYVASPYVASPYVATSYASVVRHDPAPAPVLSYAAAAPIPAPLPIIKQYAAPAVVAPVPVAVAAAKSQFHAQDEHGQYTYGYTDGSSAKTETRYADGETKGSYSYVDDTGSVQAVHYSAGADGFQAAGTNIPVHHV